MSGASREATGSFRIHRTDELGPARQWLREHLALFRYSAHDIFAIRTGFEETVHNALDHGNSGDSTKQVCINLAVDEHRAEITIEDEGPGFDYRHVKDPTRRENILRDRGRGVMLVRSFMDQVEYTDPGNRVRLVKYRSNETASEHGDAAAS